MNVVKEIICKIKANNTNLSSFAVVDDKGERVPTDVKDKDDGTYEIKFTAHRPGTYCLKVSRRVLIQISVWHTNYFAQVFEDHFFVKIVKWLNPEVHFVIWRKNRESILGALEVDLLHKISMSDQKIL